MKKLLVLIIVLAIIGGVAFAGDNQSAKYIRMLSREAATDSIDAVYFNPAGTAYLQKGFHVQLNGQTVYLDYESTSPDLTAFPGGPVATDMEMDNWVPFVPSGYLGYAGGNWSVFAGYSIPEGGGSLDYEEVIIALPNPGFAQGSLVASSATHSIVLGGSYAINDMISLGLKGEMSISTMNADANISNSFLTAPGALNGTADLKASGMGFGGSFGIHINPTDALKFSVTVESAQTIEMDIDESNSANPFLQGVLEGMVTDADRPWRIRTGLSYAFPFGLEIPVSFKYNFWDAVDPDIKQNSWSTALGLRYFLTEALEISTGVSYSTGNVEDEDLDTSFLNPELDSVTIAGGIGWEIFKDFDLDIGVLYPIYFGADGANYTNMDKQVVDMAIGITYVF